jgi:DEAD/DEAH box helicase domain-containing protein
VALTVARGRSHDETRFANPRRITADPPPTPYLDVRREAIAQRIVAKEVLRQAFQGSHTDTEPVDSVHGEFGLAVFWPEHRSAVQHWIQHHPHQIEHVVNTLLHNTELGRHRQAFVTFIQSATDGGLLAEIDRIAHDEERYPHAYLSERPAYAGLLPMFGFPTQVRLLYQEHPRKLPPEQRIDRDLALAISQFAPGGQTIKDKKILTAVGVVHYKGIVPVAVDGRGYQRRVGDCHRCSVLAIREHQPPPIQCPACGAGWPDYRIMDTWEPQGFTIEPGEADDFDGDFEWTPRATGARLGTDFLQPFTPLPATNLVYQQKEDNVLSLNSNKGELFQFHRLKRQEIWVDPRKLRGAWKQDLAPGVFYEVGLAAGKYTDILLLRLAFSPSSLELDMAGDQRLYVRAAYYSWGYLLRKAACDFLDVEPAELDVNIRPVTTDQGAACEVVFFDSLENGAGYCRYLTEKLSEALLQPLLPGGGLYDRLVQEGHAHGCDRSCYDCLRDYNNADLHALLDWRLGLDLAHLAVDAQVHVDLHAPYWQPLAEQAARSLERVVGQSAALEQIEGSWILHVKGQVRAVLTHPLWSPQHPHLTRLVARLGVAETALPHCTLFDVLHRPGWCVSQLGS